MTTKTCIVSLKQNYTGASNGPSLLEVATINLLEDVIGFNEHGFRLVSYTIHSDSRVELEFEAAEQEQAP